MLMLMQGVALTTLYPEDRLKKHSIVLCVLLYRELDTYWLNLFSLS